MKRASTKKVKAVPACANGNDALEGYLKPVQPEGNRRARTSAAMIGLAISMGASSLLLARQSDRAVAAETPTGNESTVTTVPAATESTVGIASAVEPEAASDKSASASSSAFMPTATGVQVRASAATTPPAIDHTVQEGQILWQQSHTTYEVDAATLAAAKSRTNRSEAETGQAVKAPSVNETAGVQADEKVETLTESNGVDPSQVKPPTATANSKLRVAPVTATGEVNALLKAKQAVALNRLKHTSNRLKESLAEWKSEESKTSAPVTESVESSVVEEAQTTTQESITPLKAGVTDEQQPEVAEEVATVKTKVFDSEKSEMPETTAVVTDMPSAVNEPTVVFTSVLPNYQVKPGDTLANIARTHGISLSELVKANHLSDPNRLRINQRIAIPPSEYNSAASQAVTVTKNLSQPETTSSVAANLIPASSNQTIPVVPPLSQSANNGSVSVATLPTTGGDTAEVTASQSIALNPKSASSTPTVAVVPPLSPTANNGSLSIATLPTTDIQANGEASASQNAAEQGQPMVTVPAETSIAGTPFLPSTTAVPSGIGGTMPPASSQLRPPSPVETKLAQSAGAKEVSSNPYIENLRTEILRLRQKYRDQQTGNRVIPVVTESDSVAIPISVPKPSTVVIPSEPINPQFRTTQTADEPINPEFLPNRVDEPLQPQINATLPQKRDSSGSTTRSSVAVAPIGVDASESLQSLRGRQVSPELPPLAPGDNYLPNPSDNPSVPLNGYIWPTKGVLTSGYGWRWGRMHKGIDIAAPIGTPVVAAAPGTVVKAGWNSGGYGKVVDIQHADGSLTRYAHNSRLLVQVGQQVEQGQQISEMGSTGYSTGPHCHFELHSAGRGAVNPIALLPSR